MRELKANQLTLVTGALSLSGGDLIAAGAGVGGGVVASNLAASSVVYSVAEASGAVALGAAAGAGITAAGVLGYAAGTALYNNSKTVRDGAEAVIGFFFGGGENRRHGEIKQFIADTDLIWP